MGWGGGGRVGECNLLCSAVIIRLRGTHYIYYLKQSNIAYKRESIHIVFKEFNMYLNNVNIYLNRVHIA